MTSKFEIGDEVIFLNEEYMDDHNANIPKNEPAIIRKKTSITSTMWYYGLEFKQHYEGCHTIIGMLLDKKGWNVCEEEIKLLKPRNPNDWV